MSEQTIDMLFPLLRDIRAAQAEQAAGLQLLTAQVGVLAPGQVSIRAELRSLREDVNDMRNTMHEIAIAVDSHSARLDRIGEHLGLHGPKH